MTRAKSAYPARPCSKVGLLNRLWKKTANRAAAVAPAAVLTAAIAVVAVTATAATTPAGPAGKSDADFCPAKAGQKFAFLFYFNLSQKSVKASRVSGRFSNWGKPSDGT